MDTLNVGKLHKFGKFDFQNLLTISAGSSGGFGIAIFMERACCERENLSCICLDAVQGKHAVKKPLSEITAPPSLKGALHETRRKADSTGAIFARFRVPLPNLLEKLMQVVCDIELTLVSRALHQTKKSDGVNSSTLLC